MHPLTRSVDVLFVREVEEAANGGGQRLFGPKHPGDELGPATLDHERLQRARMTDAAGDRLPSSGTTAEPNRRPMAHRSMVTA